jgi:DUF218 domain
MVGAVVVFGLILTTQCLFFLGILLDGALPVHADLIVAFEGRPERSQEAYRLADQGYAPALAISPASDLQLKAYDRQYRSKRIFLRIPERKARTTFENALYTAEIVHKNGFKSVILVTSWNHMPRSYLLLNMMLIDSGTTIYPHAVATGAISHSNWYCRTLGWKMVYNEIVETWGSMVELAKYRIIGRPSANVTGQSDLFSRLKKIILFDTKSNAPSASIPDSDGILNQTCLNGNNE